MNPAKGGKKRFTTKDTKVTKEEMSDSDFHHKERKEHKVENQGNRIDSRRIAMIAKECEGQKNSKIEIQNKSK